MAFSRENFDSNVLYENKKYPCIFLYEKKTNKQNESLAKLLKWNLSLVNFTISLLESTQPLRAENTHTYAALYCIRFSAENSHRFPLFFFSCWRTRAGLSESGSEGRRSVPDHGFVERQAGDAHKAYEGQVRRPPMAQGHCPSKDTGGEFPFVFLVVEKVLRVTLIGHAGW